jgi:hypothetical protein
MIYGEQRGAATADYDGDGRPDLVMTQVGAETKLYRNQTGRPGLRVGLEGPDGNRNGIGAVLRLEVGEKLGRAREVHAGSGYWSQDSAVQVLTFPLGTAPDAALEVHVRWPGGKVVTASVPAGAREVAVAFSGEVRTVR